QPTANPEHFGPSASPARPASAGTSPASHQRPGRRRGTLARQPPAAGARRGPSPPPRPRRGGARGNPPPPPPPPPRPPPRRRPPRARGDAPPPPPPPHPRRRKPAPPRRGQPPQGTNNRPTHGRVAENTAAGPGSRLPAPATPPSVTSAEGGPWAWAPLHRCG